MAEFVRGSACRTDCYAGIRRSRFTVGNKDLAVFNVDGTICAIADTCPHAGGSLGLGKLNGNTVTCPVHGMKFDVTTGCFAGTFRLRSCFLSRKGHGRKNHGVAQPERESKLTLAWKLQEERNGDNERNHRSISLATDQQINPWGPSLDKFPQKNGTLKRADLLLRVGTEPVDQRRPCRASEIELIALALYCSCTNLDEAGTRRQIRASLDAGATRDEILLVLKCGVGLAVHSCSLGAPILLEEMKAAGVKPAGRPEARHSRVAMRCRRDRPMEHGMGSLLRAFPCMDRSILRLRSQRLQERHLHPEIPRADQHCLRRIHHAHVRPRRSTTHSGIAQGRSDAGGDHDSPAALRLDGRSGLRQGCADPGRGTGAQFGEPIARPNR